MKITKTEKIWLIVVVALYICYNLPFVPPYHSAVGAIVHGLLTLIPLWIAIYVGLFKICRIYHLKPQPEDTQKSGAAAHTKTTVVKEGSHVK